MSALFKIDAAQRVYSMELLLNFSTAAADTLRNVSGVVQQINAIQSNVDYEAFCMIPGAVVIGGEVTVETAVVGPTASAISLGDAGSATRYANAVSMLSAARTALTLTGLVSDGSDLRIRINNTVAAATAGLVSVRVMYVLRGKADVSLS